MDSVVTFPPEGSSSVLGLKLPLLLTAYYCIIARVDFIGLGRPTDALTSSGFPDTTDIFQENNFKKKKYKTKQKRIINDRLLIHRNSPKERPRNH